jgi:hypothetical protein
MPSFVYAWLRWNSTVRTFTTSSAAISRFGPLGGQFGDAGARWRSAPPLRPAVRRAAAGPGGEQLLAYAPGERLRPAGVRERERLAQRRARRALLVRAVRSDHHFSAVLGGRCRAGEASLCRWRPALSRKTVR